MKTVLEIVFFLMLIALLNTLLSGCSLVPPTINTEPMNVSTNTQVIYETIKSTNWLNSFLLLGVVGGLIASLGLGFKRLGLVISGACIFGMFISAAFSNVWFYIGAGLVVLASIILVIAGLFWKHKAIVELVAGGDFAIYAAEHSGISGKVIKNGFKEKQSKPTQQLVQEIKGKLKVKEN